MISTRLLARAHALIASLAITGAAMALSPTEAEACSPPPYSVAITYANDGGEVTTRQPVFLFQGQSSTIKAEDFTLIDAQGNLFEVEVSEVANVLFSRWFRVGPKAPLEAGSYTLTYEVEDPSMAAPPGQPQPTYKNELDFIVDQAAQHATNLELGLQWWRLRAGPNDPVWQDSCGGSSAEQNRLEITMPAACRTLGFGARYVIDYMDDMGQVLYSRVRIIPDEDFQVGASGLIETLQIGGTQGSAEAECVRVTAYTTTGLVSSTVELCTPTGCAEGTDFEPLDRFTACTMDPNATTEVTLATPYPRADCALESGFSPCDGVVCAEGEVCVEGMCKALDPCDGVMCAEGEVCDAGQCVATDPCDGVVCAEGEACVAGECKALDPCDGVTCGADEVCVEGTCMATSTDPCDGVTCGVNQMCVEGACEDIVTEPDGCENITCGADEVCFNGKCYTEVTENNNAGNNSSGGGNNDDGGGNNDDGGGSGADNGEEDDEGCQAVPTGPADSPWGALGLLALAGLARRRRR